eukprot:2966749-Pleurochrysis_carterae.AAC.1
MPSPMRPPVTRGTPHGQMTRPLAAALPCLLFLCLAPGRLSQALVLKWASESRASPFPLLFCASALACKYANAAAASFPW